jgi:serine/threonine protein kinase
MSQLCHGRCQGLTAQDPFRARSSDDILKAQYWVLRTIGEGCFGCVKLPFHRITGTWVAVKMQQKGKNNSVITSKISILKTLYHPNIKLFQVMERVDRVYLVMEYKSRGELLQHNKDDEA